MANFKVSGNFWTVLVFAIFIGSAVYLWNTQPAIAPVFTAAMLPFVVGIIGNIQESKKTTDKLAVVDAKVEKVAIVSTEAKVAAIESKAISQENAQTLAVTAVQTAHALEQVAQQVDTNTAITQQIDEKVAKVETVATTTHDAVNGQMAAYKQALVDMAAIKAEISEARADLAAANALARGILTGREQVFTEVAAPTGSTPAHGTPVLPDSPDGTTTIVIDPASAATIKSTEPQP